jgi:hypothetical protein
MYFIMIVNVSKKKTMFVDMMSIKENDNLEIIDHNYAHAKWSL